MGPSGVLVNYGFNGPISTNALQPDFGLVSGVITVNAAGTIIPQWSQSGGGTPNATNLLANSYVMLTKIG